MRPLSVEAYYPQFPTSFLAFPFNPPSTSLSCTPPFTLQFLSFSLSLPSHTCTLAQRMSLGRVPLQPYLSSSTTSSPGEKRRMFIFTDTARLKGRRGSTMLHRYIHSAVCLTCIPHSPSPTSLLQTDRRLCREETWL